MKKIITTRQIVLTGLFLALEIIFQIIGNYLQFGPVNINLALTTVVLAAAMCGPLSGAIVGFFNGVMALFSPSTLAIFMPIHPVGTVVICLLKCAVAGLVAGFIFKALRNRNKIIALLLASLVVPIINTSIFIVGALIFFQPWLQSAVEGGTFSNIGAFLIFGVVGWNFLFELGTTVFLSTVAGSVIIKND